jgi:hypothetical protein
VAASATDGPIDAHSPTRLTRPVRRREAVFLIPHRFPGHDEFLSTGSCQHIPTDRTRGRSGKQVRSRGSLAELLDLSACVCAGFRTYPERKVLSVSLRLSAGYSGTKGASASRSIVKAVSTGVEPYFHDSCSAPPTGQAASQRIVQAPPRFRQS